MTAISSIGSSSPAVSQQVQASVVKQAPKPAAPAPRPAASSDADHDGDSDGGGIDISA